LCFLTPFFFYFFNAPNVVEKFTTYNNKSNLNNYEK